MTEKEKAIAYDKAIERARKLYGNEIAEEIFSELKENDDEKIRKWIINNIRHNINNEPLNNSDYKKKAENAIAWLEKQGEQKPCMVQWKGDNLKEVIGFTGKDKNFEKWFKSFEEYEKYVHEHNNIFKLFSENGNHYEIPVGAWIVKTPDGYNIASNAVLKQKSADKIEPKFKVGDWVVDNRGYVWKIEGTLKGMLNDFYLLEGVEGDESRPTIDWADKTFHLYTIQDAKDGDVVSFYSDYKGKKMFQIGIVEKYVGKLGGSYNTFKTYVGMDWDNKLHIGRYMGCDDIYPATKEQRDALIMKTLNDVGYEWDVEKKELKKKRKR